MPPPASGADPTSSASTTRCRATTTGACASTSSSRASSSPAVDAHLGEHLPESFAGHPTRFATTWDPVVRHRVQVETARDLAVSRLGVDPTTDLTVGDWLSLTGQAVLEVTAGEVFADGAGELDGIRRRLEWYPDDVWRHVVATDWARLAQELPVRRSDRRARRRPRLTGAGSAAGGDRHAPRPPARAPVAALRQVARHELRATPAGGAAAGPLQAAARRRPTGASASPASSMPCARSAGCRRTPGCRPSTTRSSRSGTVPTSGCATPPSPWSPRASATRPCDRCREGSAPRSR